MTNWVSDPQAAQTVEGMICYLASVCDGAATEDAQGFSGADTSFGKSLAERANNGWPWSEKQAACALKLVSKYRRQLGGEQAIKNFLRQPVFRNQPGVRLGELAPEKVKANLKTLTSRDKTAVFRFPYNDALVKAIKMIRGTYGVDRYFAQWDRDNREWCVPVNQASIIQIMEVAERFGFEVEERFRVYLARVRERMEESRVTLALNDSMNVSIGDGTLMIAVNDPAILQEFRQALEA